MALTLEQQLLIEKWQEAQRQEALAAAQAQQASPVGIPAPVIQAGLKEALSSSAPTTGTELAGPLNASGGFSPTYGPATAPSTLSSFGSLGIGPQAGILLGTLAAGKGVKDLLSKEKPKGWEGLAGRATLGMATGGLSEIARATFLRPSKTKDREKKNLAALYKEGGIDDANYELMKNGLKFSPEGTEKTYQDRMALGGDYAKMAQEMKDYELNAIKNKGKQGPIESPYDIWGSANVIREVQKATGKNWMQDFTEMQRRDAAQKILDYQKESGQNLVYSKYGALNANPFDSTLKDRLLSVLSGKPSIKPMAGTTTAVLPQNAAPTIKLPGGSSATVMYRPAQVSQVAAALSTPSQSKGTSFSDLVKAAKEKK
jgi:hypothetical protein